MSKIDNNRIITSKDLHKELNEEHKKKGLNSLKMLYPRVWAKKCNQV